MDTKYIFVTGGVVSSVGKGICAASIGMLLKNRGFKVSVQKLDPYLNVDAGTMNPFQHGEVFVSDDGAETDLDLGHYERFVDINLTKLSNITTGKIYDSVIKKERRGDYHGGTVQVIPHVTDEIKNNIKENAKRNNAEIAIVEIGGTIGDIEGQPFMEAIRQFKNDIGNENVAYVHVTLLTTVGPWNELKTKPTQHSVIKLREIGIQPDLLICRTKEKLSDDMKEKLSIFCDVPVEGVFEGLDARSIYDVPLMYEELGIDKYILSKFKLSKNEADLTKWKKIVDTMLNATNVVRIGVVGKYIENGDSYISIGEALKHAAVEIDSKCEVVWIDSETINEDNVKEAFKDLNGIIVPGGFGSRGVDGKITTIKYARENNVPFLGICYGLHWTIVETMRNIAGIADANTTEVDPNTKNPVIHLLPNQKNKVIGGTMRLGAYPCVLQEGSVVNKAYNQIDISERHRHRYEVNNNYREKLKESGLVLSGISKDGLLVEIVERPENDFFVAVQFHPEFKSRPDKPHPLFVGLIKASYKK